VTRAVVGVNRETGQSKGFGFIAFAERKAAEDAMAGLAGRDVQGRVVRLDWDPGLDARGPGARAAGGVRGAAPYEKRASPPPAAARARSPSPRRRSPGQSD
jgi:RNA recognition motif-containing protein